MTEPAALVIRILGHNIRVVDLAGTWKAGRGEPSLRRGLLQYVFAST